MKRKKEREEGRRLWIDRKIKNFSKIDRRNHCFVFIKLIQCLTLVRKAHPLRRRCIICEEERLIAWHVDSTPTLAVQDAGLRPGSLGQDVHRRLSAPRRWQVGRFSDRYFRVPASCTTCAHSGIRLHPFPHRTVTKPEEEDPPHQAQINQEQTEVWEGEHSPHGNHRWQHRLLPGAALPRDLSLFQPLFP